MPGPNPRVKEAQIICCDRGGYILTIVWEDGKTTYTTQQAFEYRDSLFTYLNVVRTFIIDSLPQPVQ